MPSTGQECFQTSCYGRYVPVSWRTVDQAVTPPRAAHPLEAQIWRFWVFYYIIFVILFFSQSLHRCIHNLAILIISFDYHKTIWVFYILMIFSFFTKLGKCHKITKNENMGKRFKPHIVYVDQKLYTKFRCCTFTGLIYFRQVKHSDTTKPMSTFTQIGDM